MKKLLYIFFLFAIISCSNKDNASNVNQSEAESSRVNETITFTDEQIELAGIVTVKPEKRKISESIQCSGLIEIPPHNIASVSPMMHGFIKNLNYNTGQFVEKGSVLATLQHPDFINLQQQYIEAKSQAEYYKEEFKRQGELTVENAASIKKMQKAKADFLSSEALYKSLKSQLQLLGVKPESIENKDFITEFMLLSPISGIVAQLNANRGKYINSDQCAYEIINDSKLNLHLNVFEKDVKNIKVGQNIQFHLLNDEVKYNSKITRIGLKLNEDNRTTMVHSLMDNKNKIFKPGMHIIASIQFNNKEVLTLPIEAVAESNHESFVFIKENNEFRVVKIEKGTESGQFIEIKNFNEDILNAEIVVKGVYYLISQLEAEE